MVCPFSLEKMQSSAKYFFQGRPVSGHDGVVKLLGATDELLLSDRQICGCGVSELGCEDDDEQKFHRKDEENVDSQSPDYPPLCQAAVQSIHRRLRTAY